MAGSIRALPSTEVDTGARASGRRFSPGLEAWRRFSRHRLAIASAVILIAMVLVILLGTTVWTVPINDIDFAARLEGPSWQHPLGTDDLGQDLLARMIYGGRISLAVGLAAMFVAVSVGTAVGAIAGMSRGWVGSGLMWLTDLFLSLPQLPLLLLVIYLFRDHLKALLGPEGMLPGRALEASREIDVIDRHGPDRRPKQDGKHRSDQDDAACDRQAVATEPPPGLESRREPAAARAHAGVELSGG